MTQAMADLSGHSHPTPLRCRAILFRASFGNFEGDMGASRWELKAPRRSEVPAPDVVNTH